MRLYIPNCSHCYNKIYLNILPSSRQELRQTFGSYFQITCPKCNTTAIYDIAQVCAEIDQNIVPATAILGGLIGALLGPEGAVLGGILGVGVGAAAAEEDKRKVIQFNIGG